MAYRESSRSAHLWGFTCKSSIMHRMGVSSTPLRMCKLLTFRSSQYQDQLSKSLGLSRIVKHAISVDYVVMLKFGPPGTARPGPSL